MTRIPPAGVFFALFTISGFAGLIYQSIWSHSLNLFLGRTARLYGLELAFGANHVTESMRGGQAALGLNRVDGPVTGVARYSNYRRFETASRIVPP